MNGDKKLFSREKYSKFNIKNSYYGYKYYCIIKYNYYSMIKRNISQNNFFV